MDMSVTIKEVSCEHNGTPRQDRTAHGPKDEVYSRRMYAMRVVAPILCVMFPRFIGCVRCLMPSEMIGQGQWHELKYKPGAALCCMCEACWGELQVPQYRLPYYMDFVRQYWRDEGACAEVYAAVMAEGEEEVGLPHLWLCPHPDDVH